MASVIPYNSTTVRVVRVAPDPLRDPYDAPPAATIVASGVRAVIASPSGRERNIGGTQEIVEYALSCDPVNLLHTDTIQDEATGINYQVVWLTQRVGLGLDHTRAGLKQVVGSA